MTKLHQFSIITPTFNRAKYLPRIYTSLCKQGDIDLEWIIIDDGSIDNTREVIKTFDAQFEVKYVFQENAGKPSAINTGVQKLAASHITLITLDSDDYLCENALSEAWKYFDIKSGRFKSDCCCLSGLCQDENGNIIGQKFPHKYFVSDYIRYHRNKKIAGDKSMFFITKILKQYPYPIFPGEKFILESTVFHRIALTHKTLFINYIFQIKQYLPEGLSSSSELKLKNPFGMELYFNEASTPPFSFRHQVEHLSRYIFFAKINKKNMIFLNAKNKKMYIFGLLKYYFNQFKSLCRLHLSANKGNLH